MTRAVCFLWMTILLSGQDLKPLMARADVKAALEAVKKGEPRTIETQIMLSEIEAPPFQEAKRGERVRALFQKNGLANVRVDAVGNVIGERRGAGSGASLVFSAHLDTVFPKGTDVRVRREGSKLIGPGIGDDARGLAVMLAVIEALNESRIETPGAIYFVATVGEEGLGDLRGVKHLFGESLKGRIDRFISVDGTGLGITHIGVGSYRYKVTFKGPGGHSFGAFGNANPIHALGRAISAIAAFEAPSEPKTTFNVGRVGGGTSVNSIAFEAWMEVDMRSADTVSLKRVEQQFQTAVTSAVALENERWNGRGAITGAAELVGLRPAGAVPESAPIVQTAVQATVQLGVQAELRAGSTDSNVPMNLGVPAVTIGGGGRGTGAHSPQETFDTSNSWMGTQRALLLAIALAQ
jgi:tripeptide aminopeptidase